MLLLKELAVVVGSAIVGGFFAIVTLKLWERQHRQDPKRGTSKAINATSFWREQASDDTTQAQFSPQHSTVAAIGGKKNRIAGDKTVHRTLSSGVIVVRSPESEHFDLLKKSLTEEHLSVCGRQPTPCHEVPPVAAFSLAAAEANDQPLIAFVVPDDVGEGEIEDDEESLVPMLRSPGTSSTIRPLSLKKPSSSLVGPLIGQGATATVKLGVNGDTGELVAIKSVKLDCEDPKVQEKLKNLENEIGILKAAAECPQIVQYLYTELSPDDPSALRIYMEYVPGGSLKSLIAKFAKAFPPSMVANYAFQVLLGLKYIHSLGIVHLDIKTDNLLLHGDGRIKIADFGCAVHLRMSDDSKDCVRGTARYMAPEVIRKDPNVGAAADVWSLGCVVMEMLTGQPPWAHFSSNPFKVLNAVASAPKDIADPPIPLPSVFVAATPHSSDAPSNTGAAARRRTTGTPSSLNAASMALEFASVFLQDCLRCDPAKRATVEELLRHKFFAVCCPAVSSEYCC